MFLRNTNKSRLKNLLIFSDYKKESIYSIIGRMESTLTIFKNNNEFNHLIPFLQTYLFVTKRVADKMLESKHSYKDYKSVEQLDIYFASLYFKPLYEYITKSEVAKPWSTYFTYCETGIDSPFTQVLVGINVHINADLCQSIVDLKFNNHYDYQLVNELLLETISDTMKFLAIKERDPFGFSGLFLNQFYKNEFERIIVKWRNNAWENAKEITRNKKSLKVVQERTDALSSSIVHLWEGFYKPSNVLHMLNQINTLEVKV